MSTVTDTSKASYAPAVSQHPSTPPASESAHTDTKSVAYQIWLSENYRSFGLRPNFPGLDELLESLFHQIREHAKKKQRSIGVGNSKGASGKTPLSMYLGIFLTWATKKACVYVEVNENAGTAKRYFQKKVEETLTLNYCIRHPDEINSYPKASIVLAEHDETGLFFIASEPKSRANDFNLLEVLKFGDAIGEAFGNKLFDFGNGNTHPANEGGVLLSDILLISTMASSAASFDDAISTMGVLYEAGHEDKIKRSFIVVNATKKKHTKEAMYERLLKSASTYLDSQELNDKGINSAEKLLEMFGITLDDIFLIPYSNYINDNGEDDVEIATVSQTSIGYRTAIAYAELLLAIFEASVPNEKEKRNHRTKILEERKQEGPEGTPSTSEHSQDLVIAESSTDKPGLDTFIRLLRSMPPEEVEAAMALAADESLKRRGELASD